MSGSLDRLRMILTRSALRFARDDNNVNQKLETEH
jgi:hypothetical protein